MMVMRDISEITSDCSMAFRDKDGKPFNETAFSSTCNCQLTKSEVLVTGRDSADLLSVCSLHCSYLTKVS
jgi:hypothetical protein